MVGLESLSGQDYPFGTFDSGMDVAYYRSFLLLHYLDLSRILNFHFGALVGHFDFYFFFIITTLNIQIS